jgi:hypothetical protein
MQFLLCRGAACWLEAERLHKPRVGGSIPPAASLIKRPHRVATDLNSLYFPELGPAVFCDIAGEVLSAILIEYAGILIGAVKARVNGATTLGPGRPANFAFILGA